MRDETVMIAQPRAEATLQEIVDCYGALQNARESKKADAAAHNAIIEHAEEQFDEAMDFEVREKTAPDIVMTKLRAIEQTHKVVRAARENREKALESAKALVLEWQEKLDSAITSASQLTMPWR